MTTATPPAPALPARQRRYPMSVVTRARTMYGDGDAWTPTQIARYLTEHGHPVHVNTVRRWVIPSEAEYQRTMNQRAAAKRRGRMDATGLPALDRMLQLRAAGMMFSAIAIVMTLDWDLPITAEQARYCCNARRIDHLLSETS